GTTILASQATAKLAGPAIIWREIDVVKVVGRSEPVGIYEPMARREEVAENQSSLLGFYAEGLRCWRSRDFASAAQHLEKISEHNTGAGVFLERSRRLVQQPAPPDWDPIHALESK